MNKYEKLTKPFKLFDKVIDDFNEAAREVTRVFPSIERQVCSLELAKKLKKLEVKQDSLRYWIYCPETKEWVLAQRKWTKNWKMYSAFTVAELGELLPFKIYSNPIPSLFDDILQERLRELDPKFMKAMESAYKKSRMSRWCA